jgi:hypothetical protein
MDAVTDPMPLVDWLASRSAEQLAVILELRPDAVWGAPLRGLDDLAARLSQPASVGIAVTALPMPAFELLHALAALGPSPTITAATALLHAANRTPDAQRDAVRGALARLSDWALAWEVDGETISVIAAAALVINRPLGLGRTARSHLEHSPVDHLRGLLRNLGLPNSMRRDEVCTMLCGFLTDPEQVRRLVQSAPPEARRRIQDLATADTAPGNYLPKDQQQREGDNWARRRGLLFGGDYFSPEMPVEIILALRAGDIVVRFEPDPPILTTHPLTPAAITSGAAGAAAEFTESVAAVLDWIARSPPPALKAGGIGTREITRIAKGIGSDDGRVRFALELVRDLALLGADGDRVFPNELAGSWRAAEPSTRFADLVVTWWGLPVLPSIGRDPEGKAIPAVGRRAADASVMTLRWEVIEAIGAQPAGTGLSSADTLGELLSWRLPTKIARNDPALATTWTEAHDLGVLTQGALTPVGRALLDADPAELLAVTAGLMAPAATLGRFGSDLTVMVAGSPSAAVSALLDSCADRESRGAAVLWRFSPASVRRALDEGRSADELLAALRGIADTDLPQPLRYLIGDVQRRHGSLTVQPALCCVRSDEESLLIEVAAHRGLRSLRPVLIAPTVIAFAGAADAVLDALRTAGYMPVPADENGVVQLGRARSGSGAAPTRDPDLPLPTVDRSRDFGSRLPGGVGDPSVRVLAAELLSAGATTRGRDEEVSDVEAIIDAFGQHLDIVERRQLAFAVDHHVPVTITYTSSTGGTTTRTISDIEMINGLMYAWCHLREDERVFSVDRVQSVRPVPA